MEGMFRSSFVGLLALLSLSAVAGGVKVSERFGYDPEDSTRFLQAALDSGEEIVIDRQEGPWYTLPLVARSGNRITLEPGVEVVAKKGAFHGSNDYLLHIYCVTNVTLRGGEGSAFRMRRDEYAKPPYKWSEWRHALRINRSVGVTVENMRFLESGGDGIVIGGNCRDVTIRNCVCDRNYRQAISLCAGENVLIENTVMSNTRGTAPEAGIDFEPDGPGEKLVNCVLRNCLSENNAGHGFECYLAALSSTSAPVSITLENCRSVGNLAGAFVAGGNKRAVGGLATGSVAFRKCRFDSSLGAGIELLSLPAGAVKVSFTDCIISNAASSSAQTDVCVGAGNIAQGSPDGLTFDRLAIWQPADRPWFSFVPASCGPSAKDVRGRVAVVKPDGSRRVERIDADWVAANMRVLNDGRPLPPRVGVPAAEDVTVCDTRPGEEIPLEPVTLMCEAHCVFFAKGAEPVRLRGRQVIMARGRKPEERPLVVTALGGKAKGRKWELRNFGVELTDVVFEPPEGGFYSLVARDGGVRYLLERSNVPIAVDLTDGKRRVAPLDGRPFSFYLGAAGRPFSVYAEGSSYYRFRLEAFDPAGVSRLVREEVDGSLMAPLDGSKDSSGLWRIGFSSAKHPNFDWIELDLFGVPGLYFLSPDKTWRLKR